MKNWAFAILVVFSSTVLHAENNRSTAGIKDNITNLDQLAKHVEEQIKREEHYKQTQTFEQGKDYNLSEHQVDPKDLENIKVDPPEYDFNMDDVYD